MLLSGLVYPRSAEASINSHTSPRIANYFLKWELTDIEATELSKWDVVILDMEVQFRSAAALAKLKKLNPEIVLLVYLTPQEIATNAATGWSTARRKLAAGIPDEWYLKNSRGERLSWWSGTYLLNVTDSAPERGGMRLNEYIPRFVVNELLSSGYWDGVYYDNSWDTIAYFAGNDIDLNLDRSPDTATETKWQEGMKELYATTRNLSGSDIIIVGNNHNTAYLSDLNGKLLENFPNGNWVSTMNTLRAFSTSRAVVPRVPIVNANTANTGIPDYRSMRYGLTSALLENAYFAYDHGDQDHGQTWWYDEYEVSLGNPITVAQSQTGKTEYAPDVWSRNFENGISIVNSTNEARTIPLDGEYEHIHGVQDTAVNDGSIVSEVTLAPKDGLILLKTFETLKNVIFTNGFFARFFKPTGERARNGLFVFEEEQKGGAQIAHIDLNFNNQEDLVVVSGNKIQGWRDDGQILFKIYPYGANYTGSLHVAVGDLDNDGFYEIYSAPSAGFREPIRRYDRNGATIGGDLFPYGSAYKGGYHMALTKASEAAPARLIVGSGVGVRPTITVYGPDFKKLLAFSAFESTFMGGVSVAAGDVEGDGTQEIIAGKGSNGAPTVKVFTLQGKEKYQSFNAYTTMFKPGIEVRTLDIDFDGKDEIVTLSDGAL